jgi:hypothetical protein
MQLFRSRLAAPHERDWLAKESLTLVSPDYEANVIFSSEPLDEGIDTLALTELNGQHLQDEFPGYEEVSLEPLYLEDGRLAYLRMFTWAPDDSDSVTQLQLYFVEDGRGYTATATSTVESFSRFEKVFRQILGGLEFSG